MLGEGDVLAAEPRQTARTLRSAISATTHQVVDAAGSAWAAAASVIVAVAWLVIGFAAGFTERWLTVLVTVTGLVTFIMVFLIQHKTGQQFRALMLKLDELIRVDDDARKDLIGAEERPLHEQEELEETVKGPPPRG